MTNSREILFEEMCVRPTTGVFVAEQDLRLGAKTFSRKHVHTKVRHLDIVFVISSEIRRRDVDSKPSPWGEILDREFELLPKETGRTAS